jgi:hypothetical protein
MVGNSALPGEWRAWHYSFKLLLQNVLWIPSHHD